MDKQKVPDTWESYAVFELTVQGIRVTEIRLDGTHLPPRMSGAVQILGQSVHFSLALKSKVERRNDKE